MDSRLERCDTTLEMCNDTKSAPLWKCRTVIRNCKNREKYSSEFIVVKQAFKMLLGKRVSEQVGLITVNYEHSSTAIDILASYDDVFGD